MRRNNTLIPKQIPIRVSISEFISAAGRFTARVGGSRMDRSSMAGRGDLHVFYSGPDVTCTDRPMQIQPSKPQYKLHRKTDKTGDNSDG